jgi:hypothetical protein
LGQLGKEEEKLKKLWFFYVNNINAIMELSVGSGPTGVCAINKICADFLKAFVVGKRKNAKIILTKCG